MLRFHDNCQFARQLFQCNERADSAWLVLENDSTAKAYLEHDSLPFMSDSSFWEVRFTVDTIRNYSFYGYEYGAEGFGDSLAVTFRPGYFYDTVEVCLVRLPDSTGETILPCGRICDTFPERTGIAETPTPQSFTLSAHPNPFNSAVTITAPAGAEVEVFDVNGRRVADTRTNRSLSGAETTSPRNSLRLRSGSDNREFIWRPAPSLGSGVYLVRASVDDRGDLDPTEKTATKRIVYLK
ncbi:MAG: T9SS type A sorting domain-containing protein [bacterium]